MLKPLVPLLALLLAAALPAQESIRLTHSCSYDGEENAKEYHSMLCHEAASNARCYSPFECTAAEFNSAGEGGEDSPGAEELWEAFEAGTADAISADLEEYTLEDYAA